jgi:hypothetical protein
MGPAYWWFAATIFGIVAVYFYWARKRGENSSNRALSESADSRA